MPDIWKFSPITKKKHLGTNHKYTFKSYICLIGITINLNVHSTKKKKWQVLVHEFLIHLCNNKGLEIENESN